MTGPVINLNIHRLSEQPTVMLHDGPDPFVGIGLSDYPAQANLFLRTAAECDALILAAVTAKDLLLGYEPPPPLDAAAVIGPYAIPANRIGEAAPLPPGHGESHAGSAGDGEDIQPLHQWRPAPEPADHCPICGSPLCEDGSHVSATSGAFIPAGPQQVST